MGSAHFLSFVSWPSRLNYLWQFLNSKIPTSLDVRSRDCQSTDDAKALKLKRNKWSGYISYSCGSAAKCKRNMEICCYKESICKLKILDLHDFLSPQFSSCPPANSNSILFSLLHFFSSWFNFSSLQSHSLSRSRQAKPYYTSIQIIKELLRWTGGRRRRNEKNSA